jgi:hypothetical protein
LHAESVQQTRNPKRRVAMAQSLAKIYIHLIFSTKFRKFLDTYEIEYDERYVWD